jgi:PilZ domain
MDDGPTSRFDERRNDPRRFFDRASMTLDIGDQRKPLICSVCDISDNGARLKLPEEVELPRIVHVVSDTEKIPAAVAWRKGVQIGLEFFPVAAAIRPQQLIKTEP